MIETHKPPADVVVELQRRLDDKELKGYKLNSLHRRLVRKSEQIADLQVVIKKQAERLRYVETQLRLHYED